MIKIYVLICTLVAFIIGMFPSFDVIRSDLFWKIPMFCYQVAIILLLFDKGEKGKK